MRKAIHVQILVIVCFLFGCAAPASPTQFLVESPAADFSKLTSTPLPIPTATEKPVTPTLTPEPGLQSKGPYFAYFREVNGLYQLVMMDADGAGRKVIEFSQGFINSLPDIQAALDMRLVSPDGHWLVFYTGSAGPYDQMPVLGTCDLTLNLLKLETKETRTITPLLSKDYPNNFVEAAKKLNDPYITADSLYQAFVNGITRSIAWSPDGQYLAFSGQMDGLSSDLYVYDMVTKRIQRLSSGDQELQWINWSPDGKWIVHSSVYWVGEGMSFDIYAAALDGSPVRSLSTSSLYDGIETWLTPHVYFENDNQNGPGDYGLRLVDIDTGEITKIWDGAFEGYRLSRSGEWLVLLAFSFYSPYPYQDDPSGFSAGLQLINLKTHERVQNPKSVNDAEDMFLRTETGETIPLDLGSSMWGNKKISLSPDSKYWAVADNQELEIYFSDLVLIKEITIPMQNLKPYDVAWNLDSSSLFFVYGADIYSANVPNGDIKIIEKDLFDSYGSTYKWINVQ